MTKFLHHLRANLVAYLALFVALGGSSYAAFGLPAGSVGARQLKNHSIGPVKFDRGSIAGYVRDWITIDSQGRILGSRPKAHMIGWRPSGPDVGGLIQWSQPISAKCVAFANAENRWDLRSPTRPLRSPAGALSTTGGLTFTSQRRPRP